jgi:hypothetical protein
VSQYLVEEAFQLNSSKNTDGFSILDSVSWIQYLGFSILDSVSWIQYLGWFKAIQKVMNTELQAYLAENYCGDPVTKAYARFLHLYAWPHLESE